MTTADHDDDPISAASAGLRALGVAPQRRVETLGLLSALIDLADERGEVRLDQDLMATEERLGIDACLEGYEWLESLGVLRRTWSGWVIEHFAEHHGPAGMTAASMAVLERHLAALDDAKIAPIAAATEVAPVVPLVSWRRRASVVAASVAAGVAVLAGAAQFVPQAAVTTRNASSGATVRDATRAVVTVAPASSAVPATAPKAAPSVTAPAVTVADAASTTTSTTLVPGLPCLGDLLRGVGTRAGLSTPTTQAAPGVLPCP